MEKEIGRWAVSALAWTKEHPKRAAGVALFFLGCLLAGLSRAGGGDPFQDFFLGLWMGLGVGCMAVGAVLLALSLRYRS